MNKLELLLDIGKCINMIKIYFVWVDLFVDKTKKILINTRQDLIRAIGKINIPTLLIITN